MKKYINKIVGGTVITLCAIFAVVAQANPVFLPPTVQTSVATSTQAQATVTNTPVTLIFDSYQVGHPTVAEGAALLLQETSSTSAATISVTFQYSQDGIDWYGDDYKVATTTNPIGINAVKSMLWSPGTTATSSRIVDFYTPIRYTKALISTTVGTSSVWAQIVPQKQMQE